MLCSANNLPAENFAERKPRLRCESSKVGRGHEPAQLMPAQGCWRAGACNPLMNRISATRPVARGPILISRTKTPPRNSGPLMGEELHDLDSEGLRGRSSVVTSGNHDVAAVARTEFWSPGHRAKNVGTRKRIRILLQTAKKRPRHAL